MDYRKIAVKIVTEEETITIDNSDINLLITVQGQMTSNLGSQTVVSITNLPRNLSDRIANLNIFSNRVNVNRPVIYVYVGRESYTENILFYGVVNLSNQGMPPDMTLTMNCIGNGINNSEIITIENYSSLKSICTQVASQIPAKLYFGISNIYVKSFSYQGTITGLLTKIKEMIAPNNIVCINDYLIVSKNEDVSAAFGYNYTVTLSDEDILNNTPRISTTGMSLDFFYTPYAQIGGTLKIDNSVFTEYNGTYIINKLDYNLSNRTNEFMYTATVSLKND